ncbi:MAG: hypothetical protein JXR03_01405 [Cyclobacteriaceae bacterium]
MRQYFILFLISVFVLTSCYDTGLDSQGLVSENDIIYLDNLSDKDAFTNDPYRIIAITPRNDQWDVIVEYSGGCEDHLFYLWWDGNIAFVPSSGLLDLELYLIHNGNGDLCEAIVRDTLSFSASEAFSANESYSRDALVTVHNETSSQAIKIDPALAELTTENCNLKARIVAGNCILSSLGGEWIQPEHDIDDYDNIILLPVRSPQDSLVQQLQSQNVKVSAVLLFGFEYTSGASFNEECGNLPDGTIIPVAINCIESF